MKRLILLGALILSAAALLPSAASAQEAGARDSVPVAHKPADGPLLKGITMSAEQSAQFQAITRRMRDEGRRAKSAEDRAKVREDYFEALRAILTDNQKAQFDENVDEIRSSIKRGRPR